MKKLLKPSLAIIAIAALTACTGGDSSDVADVYVGTWKSKCFSYKGDDGKTYIETRKITFAKVAAAQLTASYSEATVYADSACQQSLGATGAPSGYKINIGAKSNFLGSTADYSVFTYSDGVVRQGYLKADSTQLLVVIRDDSGQEPTSWGVASPYTKQ
jgi:hypothetical protein